ncbi:Hexose carrier protein HEX6 [Sesamum alatum]|uniref:Hexose carrier protein HEX6 n=1 Tax=Sesamum alatum TaxID=300844 RepID=A0AAE1YKH1_9LAMI|nr:Hexose carrier protein HEX6 [Sesamum alatum]
MRLDSSFMLIDISVLQLEGTLMAVTIAINTNEDLQYNGKVTWLVVLSCIIAATGGLLFGYDTGVTGGVTSMEPFLKKFFPGVYIQMKEDTKISNYCKFDSQLLTSFASSLYVTSLIASFFAASMTRDYGRKPSIITGGVAFLIGATLGGAAQNIYMLTIGRLLLGVGIGFANQSVPLYLSEMAPSKFRGAFNFGFQFCVNVGGLVATLINYGTEKIKGDWGWRISLAAAALPALVLVVGALFLPETPNSLIQQGCDHEKIKRLLQKIRGTDDVEEELNDLVTASETSKAIKHPFKNILQRKYRPHLVVSVAIPFFQQVTGIIVISFYAPILFMTIGSGVSASLLATVFLAVFGTCMTFMSSLIVDKLGRRVVFFVGGISMFITQMMIGGIMAAKLGDHGALSKGYSFLVVVLICVYTAAFAFSWGPLAWLVASEISPLEIRSAAQSINVAVGFFSSALISQTFLAMLCHLKYATFFFFGTWVALMTGFVYFLLPETKNVPIEKMNIIWTKHYFWKNFISDGQEHRDNRIHEPFLSSHG